MATISTHTGRDVLRCLGLEPERSRNGDRYWSARSHVPSCWFWATTSPRFGRDEFGVQFRGAQGSELARVLSMRLEAMAFRRRGESMNETTFAREIPLLGGGDPDRDAILAAKRDLDVVLARATAHDGGESFASFVRRTVPDRVTLDLPDRRTDVDVEAPV